MARIVQCPRCSCTLRVPTDSRDDFLTCPRCLAEVPNPAHPAGTTGSQSAPTVRAESATTCPECGEPVGRNWRFCPNCEAPLRSPFPGGRSAPVDVRRDNTFVQVCMILLATLGGMGVVLMLLAGFGAASDGDFTFLGYLVAGLFVVGLIGALTVVFSKGKGSTAHAIGLAAYRSLTLAGAIVLLVVLSCSALGIYLFAMCFQGKPF